MCLSVGLHMFPPAKTRRGSVAWKRMSLWAPNAPEARVLSRCEPPNMGARNQIQVLWNSNKHS